MDSSSVVAMAAAKRGPDLDAYTVRFAESHWNEWPFAKSVADRFRVRSLVVDPPSGWIWRHVEGFVDAMEEPFHAPDLLPDHVIRRMLASRGFRVGLSGIGGDELFAGYEYYRRLHALDLMAKGRYAAAIRDLLVVSEMGPFSAGKRIALRKWRSIRKRGHAPSANGLLGQALRNVDPKHAVELPQSLDARLRSDVEWSLLPYWLRAGDKSSMAVPIEIRYPFLDHRLVEFAARLPAGVLLRDGWLKWILRKAMEGDLPAEVVWRREKMGFPFPAAEWLAAARDDLAAVFGVMDNPFLDSGFWRTRLHEAIRHNPALVWRALSFELWHRRFVRGAPVLPDALRGV
jgi:asparagine synthase (glutamine-hydrolysing)